ncbi:MAG: hypothetical protein MUF23_18555 [Pirellula sp.]|jgi:hypothetical protein|nr:hypothetical protein [Pirellula sp.]
MESILQDNQAIRKLVRFSIFILLTPFLDGCGINARDNHWDARPRIRNLSTASRMLIRQYWIYESEGKLHFNDIREVYRTESKDEISDFVGVLLASITDFRERSAIHTYNGTTITFIATDGTSQELVFNGADVTGVSVKMDAVGALPISSLSKLDCWLMTRDVPPIDVDAKNWYLRIPKSIANEVHAELKQACGNQTDPLTVEMTVSPELVPELLAWNSSGRPDWKDRNLIQESASRRLSRVRTSDLLARLESSSRDEAIGFARFACECGNKAFVAQLPEQSFDAICRAIKLTVPYPDKTGSIVIQRLTAERIAEKVSGNREESDE